MDTKSKKLFDRTGFRALLFALCVLLAVGSVSVFAIGVLNVFDDSPDLGSYAYYHFDDIYDQERAFTSSDMFASSAGRECYELLSAYVYAGLLYKEGASEAQTDSELFRKEAPLPHDPDTAVVENETWEGYFKDLTGDLKETGVVYFISGPLGTFTNIEGVSTADEAARSPAFRDAPARIAYEKGELSTIVPEGNRMESFFSPEDIYSTLASVPLDFNAISMYMAWPEGYIEIGDNVLTVARSTIRISVATAAAFALLAIVCFIMLLVLTGRRRADGTRRLYALDRIFVEVQAIALILIVVIVLRVAVLGVIYASIAFIAPYMLVPTLALLVAIATVILWFILSLVRNLKAGLFIERSLIYRAICRPIKALTREVVKAFDGRNPLAKVIVLMILLWGFAVCVTTSIIWAVRGSEPPLFILLLLALFVAIPILTVYFSLRWVRGFEGLKKGVGEIARGNIRYRIPIAEKPHTEFDLLSEAVNSIGAATDEAVQNELKNQRLKTDLISNVSHDLKTPLTSMITYTDLLRKEGLDGERAEEYLGIIEEKTLRLKKLTEDLFDAAKASSGAVTVRLDKVDALALIEQELAEFDERFRAMDLEVIVGAEREHFYVHADSQLLWRVVDNLLNNVGKYALPGSRVYIDLGAGSESGAAESGYTDIYTTIAIKNISAMKLNIPADELLERFRRGDEARATEGSGLGLAIANDLLRLMDGHFALYVDGDLFKVTATLRTWMEEPQTSEETPL